MEQAGQWLAIDFGTSNSAAGCLRAGAPTILELEPGRSTLPTAVFFDFEERCLTYGTQAEQALFEGAWGRYMRALKSLLGTPLIRENGRFLGKRMSYLEIVAAFLAELKRRAETQAGVRFTKVLSGRPVRFHHVEARDAQALADLTEAYSIAGFEQVVFMNEPEAAARARRAVLGANALGLVVDIGGGTSDFTVFRKGQGARIDILQSSGLRLGGTDFDRVLSFEHIMPVAGRGSRIKHVFGAETHIAPNGIFADLATWQKIPFLYTPDTLRSARDLVQYALEPEKLARLVRLLEDERGHDLAFAIEAAKIALNAEGTGAVSVDLEPMSPKLNAELTRDDLAASLTDAAGQITGAARDCVARAGYAEADISHVVLVGGSSLMGVIQEPLRAAFPSAALQQSGALTGIIEGLVLALTEVGKARG